MKFINRAIAIAAVLTLSAISGWAQAKECTEEFKTATYQKWYDNVKTNQEVAYQAAVEYLTVCPNEPAENAYATALKNFKKKYEDATSATKLETDFDNAVKAKNYGDQIRLGKQLVAIPKHADNAVIYILMAGAGLGDQNLLSESAQAAKKAIELVEAGKSFDKSGYTTKDQALAAMNYLVAKSTMKTSPTDAIPFFIKAAKYESDVKKTSVVYNELATAYGEGPLDKLAKEYKVHADAGKSVESPEIKLVVANINQVLDRQIDAFARAAAVSTSPAEKQEIMKVLAAVYKDRNKKDAAEAELNTMVASALSKPLPDAPVPITTLPASAGGAGAPPASPAPTGTAVGNPASGNSGSGSAMSPTTKPAPSTGAPTTPAKPTASPTPKPRRNHRRG